MKVEGSLRRTKRVLQMIRNMSPFYFFLVVLEEIISRGRPILSLFFGAKIIDGIAARKEEQEILGAAMLLVVSNMLLALIQWLIDKVLIVKRRILQDRINAAMAEKSLEIDYQILEKSEIQESLTKIREGTMYNGGFPEFCQNIAFFISSCLKIFYVICVLVPLFLSNEGDKGHGIYGAVNSWYGGALYIAALAAFTVYHCFLYHKVNVIQSDNFECGIHSNRVFSYFWGKVSEYQQGKSVRIYHMVDMIKELHARQRETIVPHWMRDQKRTLSCFARMNMASALIMAASYFFIGLKVLSGAVSIGEFTFYAGVLASMAETLVSIMNLFANMNMSMKYLINYADYLELPNEKYDGTLPIEKRLDNDYELEFKNVSFHYPNNDDLVLKNITAKIHVGRKMAIVGRNGSGKSTFIKLLCRLYDPTEGEILLNGIDIKKYDYDEYRRIFGVVFQDFQLFSFSVAQNVAAGNNYDREKVREALGQAGLRERVEGMENGIETVIYKQEDEGVEISGGEAQKIAIARALYKDAPVVILDEPTAALDPVSELEIYERFDGMVKEKTAIYISHRMSSCRFCENILVFEGGNILQMGSHQYLSGQDGLYASLWRAQAQYYQ